ncbi:MAG: histidinol-phosphate transaminase [Succinivibrio sp.]|nr:histidinol-phosphate transaminase [Succinivibrio sp.]MDY5189321.1 histidinol-phosphate transaminase [Succinivibrio sp.]
MTNYSSFANGGITLIKPYQAGKPIEEVQRELGLKDVIKLASNENPFGMGPKAKAAALACVENANLYPDSNGYYLKQKLQQKFSYNPNKITLGAGSNELINLLFAAFVNEKVNVVFPEYSFVVYPMETTVNGAKAKVIPLKDYNADLDAILEAIDENTRIVAFANPSNPIGTAISSKSMYEFLKKVPKQTLVVIDEAYNEFNSGDDTYQDSAKWTDEFENLVISRTFSKAYGLAGLRVGYMIANEEITSILNRLRAPFNVNIVALAAATAALDDEEFLQKTVNNNTKERARYEQFCKAHNLFMIPSKANFVAIDFKGYDAQKIADKLLHKGVIVRPLLGYKLKDILRVSIGTESENDRFFTTLEAILKEER